MVLGPLGEFSHVFLLMFAMLLDFFGCTQPLQTITHVTRKLQPHHQRIMRQLIGYMPLGTTVPAVRPKRSNYFYFLSFFCFLTCVVKSLRSRTGAFVSKSRSATNRQANLRHRKLRFGVTPVMVLATRVNPAKRHGSRRRFGVTFVSALMI